MNKFITSSVAVAIGLLAPQPSLAAELTLDKGTMSLGGSAGIVFGASNAGSLLSFGASPSFGYFVADNVQIFGTLRLNYASNNFGDSFGFGIGAGANYIVDLNRLKFYAGGHVAGILETNAFNNATEFWIGAQSGLLFPLSDRVAMDLGIRPEFEVNSGLFLLNVGWLGINAYF